GGDAFAVTVETARPVGDIRVERGRALVGILRAHQIRKPAVVVRFGDVVGGCLQGAGGAGLRDPGWGRTGVEVPVVGRHPARGVAGERGVAAAARRDRP